LLLMSDKEIIIRSLHKIDRRIRGNRLLREVMFGLSMFLLVPVIFKVWDLFRPFRGVTVITVLGLWFIGVVVYFASRLSRKGNLSHAAAAIDKKASLHDELKSAYWFLTHPTAIKRSTDWVELQVRRAAQHVIQLDVERHYPTKIPSTSYVVVGLIALFVGLNFVPLSQNHNWAYLQAAPAFSLSPEEQRLINQTKQLLKQAEKLDQPELVKKLEEIVENLQAGNIDTAEALRQLEDLRNQLDEGNLDMANINEGLDEMAKDLQGNPETDDIAKAMSEHNLQESADKLRELANDLTKEDDAAKMKALEEALQQASDNNSPSMQKLADDMKNAANSLADKNSKGAQDALNQASKDLQNLADKVEQQLAKNSAAQQLQDLQDQIRQRQQQAQGKEGQQQAGKGQQGQQSQSADAENAEGESGAAEGSGSSEQASGSQGKEGQQPGKPGADGQAGAQGQGQDPSGAGNAPMNIMGAPTKLNVQLEQEKLNADGEGGTPQNIEEASKQERSKLDYRNVRSELSPAQKDVLTQDKIPWEYKSLIKNYFQAIRPPRGK
jgi:hypothetical protein